MTIADWDVTSPGANGPAGQGDDELRLIKEDVKTVWPAVTVEIQKGVGGPQPTSGDFTALFDDVALLQENSGQGGLPIGVIMMWSGTDAAVPSGFTLCNGTDVNGITVPDLRGRFIVASGALTVTGQFGGSGETQTAGAFSATVTVDDHIITAENVPDHAHSTFVDAVNTGGTNLAGTDAAAFEGPGHNGNNNQPYGINPAPSNPTTIEPNVGRTSNSGWRAGAVQPLVHSSATVEGDGHTHLYTPVYFSLAYIMYVGVGI